MKRYEGLFILNTAGKEEGIKDVIDKIEAEIATVGAKVETTQKMEKRPFARVADKKYSSGYYVNIIFQGPETCVTQLRTRFAMSEDVFRAVFTVAAEPKTATAK
jgi:ribosomal protein S6